MVAGSARMVRFRAWPISLAGPAAMPLKLMICSPGSSGIGRLGMAFNVGASLTAFTVIETAVLVVLLPASGSKLCTPAVKLTGAASSFHSAPAP